MYTETINCDVDDNDVIQDIVRMNLVVSRNVVENGTVEQLRQTGKYGEEHLRMVGLVEHLVEEYGHHYGAGLLYALLYSMDVNGDGDGIQSTLDSLGDKVDEFKEGFSRPYVPKEDADEDQLPAVDKLH
jgi:hypothetical protein